MKAVIMAGGQGTRGRPYTEYFPKAMTPICDKPLIDHIIRYVQSFEFIDGVIVISDYNGLGGQILNYYGARVWTDSKTVADMSCDNGVKYDDDIHTSDNVYDKMPASCITTDVVFVQDSQSGTGGDLLHISELIPDGEPFVLWFVDNLCAIDLYGMRGRFDEYGSAACIATRTKRSEATGFAILAKDGCTVRRFVEKPVMNLPSSECLGVYILDKSILGRISDLMKKRKKSVYTSSKTNDHTPKKERWTRLNNDNTNHGNDNSTATSSTPIQVNLSHDILEDLSGEENDNGSVSAFDIGDSEWVDVESPAILERHKSKISSILDAMKHMAK